MAVIDVAVNRKILDAIEVIKESFTVRAVYIFGSQCNGTADTYSDIDIAVFIDHPPNWDLRLLLQTIGKAQKQFGDDLEFHLFSSDDLLNPPPGSFAKYIIEHGVVVREE